MSVSRTSLALLALLTAAWGVTWPAMKLSLTFLSPWTFRALCMAVGGVSLLAIARAMGHTIAVPEAERRPLLVVSLLNMTGWHILSAYGLTYVGAGRASIVGYTFPLWTVLIARLLYGERLPASRVVALLLGLTGLAVLIGPDLGRVHSRLAGAGFMLAAAVSWGTGTVFIKRYRWTIPTVVLTGWQVLLGGLPVVAGALLVDHRPTVTAVSPAQWVGLAYALVGGTVFCQFLWFHLVRVLPPSVAAIGVIGVPVAGVFTSALVLDEAVGAREVFALACMLPALGLVLAGPDLARLVARWPTGQKVARNDEERAG